MGRKFGGSAAFLGRGAGCPSNTMCLGPRPTCMPSFILIHSGIWPQCTNVADRTGQRSDSIGRTVLQTVRPINSVCLCHCVSVCLPTLLRLHFLIDFRQKWHRGNDPKSKNEFAGINITRALTLFCPQNRHFGPKGSEHPWKHKCANFCLNVRKSPVFPRHAEKWGRGTRRWCQISDRK